MTGLASASLIPPASTSVASTTASAGAASAAAPVGLPAPAAASSLAPARSTSLPPPGFPPPSLPPPKPREPLDSDIDEEGYLRSDALHTLLDPSELSGVRDASRFAIMREAALPTREAPSPSDEAAPAPAPAPLAREAPPPAAEAKPPTGEAPISTDPSTDPDDVADIPIEIGPELSERDGTTAGEARADNGVTAVAPSEELAARDSSRDSLEVDVAAGSEHTPAPAAPAHVAATTLADPDSHTFQVPADRTSEVPTEVDPEDMEIEEVAATPVRIPLPVRATAQPRSSGAELAAAVEAQNANETPAFKRIRYWWDELFGDDFLRTMDKLTDVQVRHEVNFIEESLGVQKSGIVLDLACGSGRHAVEMASRGYNVVGYDLSVAMLARAADEAQDRKQKLNFLHGDMRDMGFEEMFDGIYCWSTSFGYFDDDKNLLVAQNIHRALRKGGMFLLDLANRDFVAQRQPSLVWFEGEGCVCMDEMRVDFITSRLKVKRMVMLEDGRSRELDYSIRLYTLHELGRMLHEVGFKVTEVSGQPATRGVFMGADSPRMIVLAEKAG